MNSKIVYLMLGGLALGSLLFIGDGRKASGSFSGTLLSGFKSIFGGDNNGNSKIEFIAEEVNNEYALGESDTVDIKEDFNIDKPIPVLTPNGNNMGLTPSITASPMISTSVVPKPLATSAVEDSNNNSNELSNTIIPSPTPSPAGGPTPTPSIKQITPSPSITPIPIPTPISTLQPQNPNVLISEIRIAGNDAGDEFIELYNPNNEDIDMSNWSVQYLSGSTEDFNKISKKNFISGSVIRAYSFFLIVRNTKADGSDGYMDLILADMGHRSFSMSGASSGGRIFLVNNSENATDFNDPSIVDYLDYSFLVPESGQSLERKALVNEICSTSQGQNELKGNGCDSNNDSTDFELRENPNPQNTKSLIEPE